MRATVSDFGPLLLGKVLQANETQEQSLSLLFRYADQKGLPLLDLSDLRALLTFLGSEDGKAELTGIGGVASSTIGVLLRQLVQLEDGGGTEFFGEPQLEIADLMRARRTAAGVISCLELPAVQDKPTLFSTALMWMLAELFEELPEIGDRDKPKLVFFFDEAHLLFDGATKAFLDSIVQTVRLIRSKGVGVFFITQQPKDVPTDVLAQLGNRIQYALRAFTPDDAKALRATVSTFPKSDFYDLATLLTSLGIGEAAVTILNESGVPTPVVHTKIRAPRSKMAAAADVDGASKASPLFAKYGTRVEAQSAREMLAARMAQHPPEAAPTEEHKKAAKASGGGAGAVGKFLNSRTGRRIEGQVDPRPVRDAREAAQVGQAAASFSRVAARCSGITFTSASTGMKFVSPAQRGTTCRWTWSTMPAPAIRPRFQPEVVALRRVRLGERGDSALGQPVDLERLLVGQLAELADVPDRRDHQVAGRVRELVQEHEGRCSAVHDERLGVVPEAAARQKTQPSCSSACWMYSRRQGAQSGLVTEGSLPDLTLATANA